MHNSVQKYKDIISLIDKKEVENFIIESSEILYDNMPLLIDDNIHLKLKEIIENDISCIFLAILVL